jgi:mRNA interferase RelE/StbE
MYTIEITRAATKALTKMPRNVAQLIRSKIGELAANPFAQNNNVTKLQGIEGYRLRVGDWRVVYELDNGKMIIVVVRIAPRGGAYD